MLDALTCNEARLSGGNEILTTMGDNMEPADHADRDECTAVARRHARHDAFLQEKQDLDALTATKPRLSTAQCNGDQAVERQQ
jgi:hypothetical protein